MNRREFHISTIFHFPGQETDHSPRVNLQQLQRPTFNFRMRAELEAEPATWTELTLTVHARPPLDMQQIVSRSQTDLK